MIVLKKIWCAMDWYTIDIPLHQQNEGKLLKHKVMNTDNTLARISSMITSESSYMTLIDMINEMDLELMDISLA